MGAGGNRGGALAALVACGGSGLHWVVGPAVERCDERGQILRLERRRLRRARTASRGGLRLSRAGRVGATGAAGATASDHWLWVRVDVRGGGGGILIVTRRCRSASGGPREASLLLLSEAESERRRVAAWRTRPSSCAEMRASATRTSRCGSTTRWRCTASAFTSSVLQSLKADSAMANLPLRSVTNSAISSGSRRSSRSDAIRSATVGPAGR